MPKSIKVHQKKRRGRPATGRDPVITVRLPQAVIAYIDRWAVENSCTRSEAIRRVIERGLADNKKPLR
jgi:hypothetical protein